MMFLPGGVVFFITHREQFGPATFLWDVNAPDVARAARPGHFVMARIDEHGERIPLTVADFDTARGTVTVVLVGGGLGVAPVFPQLRAYKQQGNRTISILGFRNRDLVFWEDRFREFSDELIVTTDDGSYGRKGFVTHALAEILEREK